MQTTTSVTNIDIKDLNGSNYIILYNNFKQLSDFQARNQSFLIGRACYRLQHNYRLSLEQIGECFGLTGANIAKMVNLYRSYFPSSSPTLAASEQSADIANVPLDGSTHLSPATACAGRSTQAGDFCLAKKSNGKDTND